MAQPIKASAVARPPCRRLRGASSYIAVFVRLERPIVQLVVVVTAVRVVIADALVGVLASAVLRLITRIDGRLVVWVVRTPDFRARLICSSRHRLLARHIGVTTGGLRIVGTALRARLQERPIVSRNVASLHRRGVMVRIVAGLGLPLGVAAQFRERIALAD